MTVRIDKHLPTFDHSERHETLVHATPADVFAALRRAGLRSGPIIRALFALRSVPGLLVAPRATLRRFHGGDRGRPVTIDGITRAGFFVLDEEPGRELVIGTIGRFWQPSGGMRPTRPEEFDGFAEPGWAKAAWNFAVAPGPGETTVLSTETRIACTDDRSRRRFRWYWAVVRPFSGLIRIEMLRIVRREAEARSR
jgi:hypothetical protein